MLVKFDQKDLQPLFVFLYSAQLNVFIIVPTPLEGGGGTIYTNGFFLFSQFWPIDIFIVES